MFLKKLKIGKWWHYKIPPLLSVTYLLLCFSQNEIDINTYLYYIFLFLIAIIGTAAYGHIINDCFDIEQDKKAGKYNAFANLSLSKRWFTIIILVIIAIVPWFFLPTNALNISLLACQFLVLTIYAIPPFRFKERAWLGVVSDALYAYVIPFGVAFSTFALITEQSIFDFKWLIVAMTFWYMVVGMRGIIFHQITDFDNDIKSGITTWAIEKGKEKSFYWLRRILFPLEILFLGFVISILSFQHQHFILLLLSVIYFIYKYILISYTKNEKHLNLSNEAFIQHYFYDYLNDFYEKCLPLCFLAIVIIDNPMYWPLAFLHILLFRNIIAEFLLEGTNDLQLFKEYFGLKKQWQNYQLPIIMLAIYFFLWQNTKANPAIYQENEEVYQLITKIVQTSFAFIFTWIWSYLVIEYQFFRNKGHKSFFMLNSAILLLSIILAMLWKSLINDNQVFISIIFYYLSILAYAILSAEKQQKHFIGYILAILKGLFIPLAIVFFIFNETELTTNDLPFYILIIICICAYSLRNIFYEQDNQSYFRITENNIPKFFISIFGNRIIGFAMKFFTLIFLIEIISFGLIILLLQELTLLFIGMLFLIWQSIRLKYLWYKPLNIMQLLYVYPIKNFEPWKRYEEEKAYEYSFLYVSSFYVRCLPVVVLVALLSQYHFLPLLILHIAIFRNFVTDFLLEDIGAFYKTID